MSNQSHDNKTEEHEEEVEKSNEYLFDMQIQAPAPSQSYHQVLVTMSDVILRTWPKRRLSQTWTRDGNLNPTNDKLSHDEFLKGELQDQVKHLFGAETLDKIIGIINSSH